MKDRAQYRRYLDWMCMIGNEPATFEEWQKTQETFGVFGKRPIAPEVYAEFPTEETQ